MFHLFFYQKIIGVDGDNRQLQLSNDYHALKSAS